MHPVLVLRAGEESNCFQQLEGVGGRMAARSAGGCSEHTSLLSKYLFKCVLWEFKEQGGCSFFFFPPSRNAVYWYSPSISEVRRLWGCEKSNICFYQSNLFSPGQSLEPERQGKETQGAGGSLTSIGEACNILVEEDVLYVTGVHIRVTVLF